MSMIPAKLAYKIVEPVNGTNENLSPMIFLHAFGGSKEFWHNIPQEISNQTGRKSYLLDMRDHGDSEWTSYFSFVFAVDDLIHFMDSKNIPKAVLIGHSSGGFIASRLALKMPEKVEILFIEETFIERYKDSVVKSSFQYLALWEEAAQNIPRELDMPEATKFAVDYVYSKIPQAIIEKNYSKKEVLYKCNFPVKRKPDGSYDVKQNMPVIKVTADNPSTISDDPDGTFEGPTYVLYGNRSHFKVKDHEAKIREHFPFVRMILFPGATHNLHVEYPNKFIDTVVKYLRKHTTLI